MSLEVDLTAKLERNLKVLRAVDSRVVEIVEDYTYLALYQFDAIAGKWEKLDVEGSAFITRSDRESPYALIVLNRKGPSDFVLDLNTVMKLKVQEQYIMLRCSTQGAAPVVFGIWLHEHAERTALFRVMERIVFLDEKPTAPQSPTKKKETLMSVLKPNVAAGSGNTPQPKQKLNQPQTSDRKSNALMSILKGSSKDENATDVHSEASSKADKLKALIKCSGASGDNKSDSRDTSSYAATQQVAVTSSSVKSQQLKALLGTAQNSSEELMTDGDIARRKPAANTKPTTTQSGGTALLKGILMKPPATDKSETTPPPPPTAASPAQGKAKLISPSDLLNY